MRESKRPELRFSEFTADWQELKLNEVMFEAKKRNMNLLYGKSDVLSVSGELGVVNQIEHLGRSYAGASVKPYHVVETGDVVYTKSPLKSNPYGIIKVNKGKPGIVSTLYAVYSVRREKLSGSFIDYYFSLDDNTNRYLRPLVKKGAKNDMKVNNAHVLSAPLFFPSLAEQQKIAAFFTAIDEKLAGLRKQKSALEAWKRGVMQRIFLQELRFRNEYGEEFGAWKERRLGDLAERVTRKNSVNNANVLTISARQGLISQLDYFNKSIAAKNLIGYYLLQKGDYAYNKSYSNGYPMGAIKRLKNYDSGVVSTLYICFRFKEGTSNEFFDQYFEIGLHNSEIEKVAQEGARNHGLLNIGVTDFFNIMLKVPSLPEQTKIANFLSTLDDKIAQCSRQIAKVETWKKGLLQRMFV